MKVSLNWLRELVELPPTTDELVHLLTMAGVEVEGIETTGCAIPKVVVAQIQSSEQHPNADRLSVCQVDDGTGTPRQIVCGAKNYKVGDKVPLALPGAQLGPDFTIKVGKLRGVESQGMLCSADELGLPKGEDGLLILSPETKVGTPIADLFPGDTVLDLEVTPNRADLLSHLGIAREIGALTGNQIDHSCKWPGQKGVEQKDEQPLAVALDTDSPCFYTATLIEGTKVAPSPDWLRTKIESVGVRSINNAVDVTNFVMLIAGQPVHVFDAAKVQGAIHVRDGFNGEELVALDGKTYSLTPDDLVIADDLKPLAIAGIMGGLESGVTNQSKSIILEVANFEAKRIRRTSRRLGLSSDSSYRFERGVDVLLCGSTPNYIANLVAVLTEAACFYKRSVKNQLPRLKQALQGKTPTIPLRHERLTALLGVDVPESRVQEILQGFGLNQMEGGWRPPSFRPDLTREVDLIEEVARVIGMDAIPARVQARFVPASTSDRAYDRAMELRRALVSYGLHEARSITLAPEQPLGLGATQVKPESLVRVKNPMISDQVVLRPNLLHGLLKAVADNTRAGAKTVRLFEIGRTFHVQKPEEYQHAAFVLTGPVSERTWRGGEGHEYDLFDLKGIVAGVLGDGVTFKTDTNPALALAISVEVNGKWVGLAGQLWPNDARALDAGSPVLFAEIDLVDLAKAEGQSAAKKYREIPRFPSVTRDIAMLAPLDLAHAAIEQALLAAKEPLLAKVELFDVFTDATGAKIPADKKSIAYSLTYRATDRTLTADEVNTAHGKLKAQLHPLGIALRE